MRRGSRLAGEVSLVAVVIVVCVAAARLAPSDTVLVAGLTLGVLVLLRVLPDADSPRLARLPTPERSGRRADVYRLSWGLGGKDEGASHQVVARVAALVAERLDPGPGPEPGPDATLSPHLTVLREVAAGPLRTGALTTTDLRRTLTALEELDRLDQRTEGTP